MVGTWQQDTYGNYSLDVSIRKRPGYLYLTPTGETYELSLRAEAEKCDEELGMICVTAVGNVTDRYGDDGFLALYRHALLADGMPKDARTAFQALLSHREPARY